MNRWRTPSICAGAAVVLALCAGIACAQAPAAKLGLEQSARDSAANMDAMQKAMDVRVRRATQSICVGCSGGANRPHRGVPRSVEEPRPRDPAQAPGD